LLPFILFQELHITLSPNNQAKRKQLLQIWQQPFMLFTPLQFCGHLFYMQRPQVFFFSPALPFSLSNPSRECRSRPRSSSFQRLDPLGRALSESGNPRSSFSSTAATVLYVQWRLRRTLVGGVGPEIVSGSFSRQNVIPCSRTTYCISRVGVRPLGSRPLVRSLCLPGSMRRWGLKDVTFRNVRPCFVRGQKPSNACLAGLTPCVSYTTYSTAGARQDKVETRQPARSLDTVRKPATSFSK